MTKVCIHSASGFPSSSTFFSRLAILCINEIALKKQDIFEGEGQQLRKAGGSYKVFGRSLSLTNLLEDRREGDGWDQQIAENKSRLSRQSEERMGESL